VQNGSRRYWSTLGIAFFLSFSIWAPLFCVPPMENILKQEFSISNTQASLLFTIPIVMLVVMAIPSGLLADKIGVKKSICFGLVAVAIGAMGRGIATNYLTLLAFSLIYGLGFGWVFTNLPKLVSPATPAGRAGITAGIYFSGALFGDALALAITLPLIYHLTHTYQGVFLWWSIPAFFAAVLCWVIIKEQPVIKSPGRNVMLLGKVLKNKGLWLVGILLFFHNFYFYTFANWGPQLMMQKGANPNQASLTTSLLLWVAVPTVFLMPQLAFRLGLKKPLLWVPGIALALFAWAAIYTNLTLSWLIMILIGIVNITRFITILALPTEMVPAENIGAASGLIFCLGYLGATVGPIISGHILDLTGNLKLSLYSLVALSLIAAGIALFLPETSSKVKKY